VSLRIALATCSELTELDPDDQPLVSAFAAAGIEATPVVWSDSTVDWDSFDQVIIRNTWDYTDHLSEFLTWVNRLSSKIHNPTVMVKWNSNKTYLQDLKNASIPVIETQFISDPLSHWTIPPSADFVVKPSVSAGSRDTLRLAAADPTSRARAQALIESITRVGKSAMVQPYLDRVDADGETALLYIGGKYSHSIRKGPLLQKDIEVEHVHGLYLQEDISTRTPRPEQRDLAERVIELITDRFGTPLYARIDLLDDQNGQPLVLEVELVEPSIFFGTSPASYDRFVAATFHSLEMGVQ
jgi:glutathione synthase/RimK-type ligase-like ATP-grasp enzyme